MGKEAAEEDPSEWPAVPAGGAAVGRRDWLTLLLLLVLEQRGQVWCERREEGVPSWLAAAWAFSVLNLCCRGLSSRLFPKKQIPCLGTAPRLSLQGQVPHRVLQQSPRFPAVLLYSPPSHQAQGSLAADARSLQRRGAGAGRQGAVRPWPSRLGCSWAFLYSLCRTGTQAPTSLQTPQPLHDTLFSHVTEPTSFILSCACNFPLRHASSSQMPHSVSGAALVPGQNVVETKWLKNS